MKKPFLFVICCLFSIEFIAAQDVYTAKLDSLFGNAHKLNVFNGNVLVAEKNKILYQKSFGKADAAGKTKLDESYRFNIGSIAKEFNAVAIMMLKEKGKLSLTDRVSKYLTTLPKWADSISILNLLQYTSGVPNSKWNEIKGDSSNLESLKKVTKLDFVPGTKYAYNNNNTFLQRQIVAKVSGMSFNDFVKKNILKPLGMTQAIIDPTKNDPKIALAFNNLGVEDDITPPISGWTTVTINDFYTWATAVATYKLISPASTKEILYGFAPGNQAGLGKGIMEGKTLVSHTHDGTTRNYQALLVTFAKNNRVVLLLTNNQQNNLYAFNRSIQAILDGKPVVPVKKSLLATFRQEIASMNAEQFLGFYAEQREKNFKEFSFESEDCLNEIGYSFLNSGKTNDAIAVFKENTRRFPNSANVWDSLGEGALKAQDKTNALTYYKKAYQLDSTLESAKRMINELSKEN